MTEAPPRALPDRLLHYLNGGFGQVQGWCSGDLWQVIEPILAIQRREELDAPVCEIGVHHGKFFIGLANTVETAKKSLAIDVFEMQELNVDRSGQGSRRHFLDNVAKYADPDRVVALAADSLSLDAARIAEIEKAHGKFAFFSVDGSHTAKHTMNDVRVAMQLTAPGGIIFVDDYHNPYWPGVQEGMARLYADRDLPFVPVCLVSGKLLLADGAHRQAYLGAIVAHLKRTKPEWQVTVADCFGVQAAIVHVPHEVQARDPLPLPLGAMSPALRQYLTAGMTTIPGTANADLWAVIHPIEVLRRREPSGAPVCGVGVGQGRFFIGLLNTVETETTSLAIDRFRSRPADDDNPVDELLGFLANVARYADPQRVSVRDMSSLDLGTAEIEAIAQVHGKFAYFSIEGARTMAQTVHDLSMAMQLTEENGLIFIDHYYSSFAQGVQEGVVKLFDKREFPFAPLCYFARRLVLTGASHHAKYTHLIERHIGRRYPTLNVKECERFGWRSLTIAPDWRMEAAARSEDARLSA